MKSSNPICRISDGRFGASSIARHTGLPWASCRSSTALSPAASPRVLTVCHIIRYFDIFNLGDFVDLTVLANHVDRLDLPATLHWLRLPVVDPSFLSVELRNQIVNVLDLSLILCPSQMRIGGYVLIKVIVLDIANLAISVVYLGPRNGNIAHGLPYDSFHLRSLLNLRDFFTFVLMLLNVVKPLDSVDPLIECLAGVHAFRSIGYQVVDVILSSLWHQLPIPKGEGIGRNWVELMVNLLVTLSLRGQDVLFLEARHAVAVQILVKFNFRDHEVL